MPLQETQLLASGSYLQ